MGLDTANTLIPVLRETYGVEGMAAWEYSDASFIHQCLSGQSKLATGTHTFQYL